MGNYDAAARLLQELARRTIDEPAVMAAMAQAYATLAVADAVAGAAPAVERVPVAAQPEATYALLAQAADNGDDDELVRLLDELDAMEEDDEVPG